MERPTPSEGVVAVGGGHGLARALTALRHLRVRPTAVVTVADDGGSSGRLRDDLGIIPPGDMRMALQALARNTLLGEVMAHRYRDGQLRGHALGNLLLVALAERHDGDFLAALRDAETLLDCDGRVLPVTCDAVRLVGHAGGRRVRGQKRLAGSPGVQWVWLEPSDVRPAAPVLVALESAHTVVLGPGSLYTSIIPPLLVPGVAETISASHATTVLIANLATQPGETEGLDLTAHVQALLAHVPGLRLDVVVVHDGPPVAGPGRSLGRALHDDRVGLVLCGDLAARGDGVVRAVHDERRLADLLRTLLPAGGSQ